MAKHWFYDMSPAKQKEYIKKHPNSIYAKKAKSGGSTRVGTKAHSLALEKIMDTDHEHRAAKRKSDLKIKDKHADTTNKLEGASDDAAREYRKFVVHKRNTGRAMKGHAQARAAAGKANTALEAHYKKIRQEQQKAHGAIDTKHKKLKATRIKHYEKLSGKKYED